MKFETPALDQWSFVLFSLAKFWSRKNILLQGQDILLVQCRWTVFCFPKNIAPDRWEQEIHIVEEEVGTYPKCSTDQIPLKTDQCFDNWMHLLFYFCRCWDINTNANTWWIIRGPVVLSIFVSLFWNKHIQTVFSNIVKLDIIYSTYFRSVLVNQS